MDGDVYDFANKVLFSTRLYGLWIFNLISPQCQTSSLTFTDVFEIASETNTEHEGFTSKYCVVLRRH